MAIGNPRLLSQTDQESWQIIRSIENGAGHCLCCRIELGYTHSQLVKLNEGVNFPTLRNIRDGKEMKKATERFYLKLFFDLINKEYERRMASGGVGAVSLLIVMKNILEAELK